MTRAGMPTIERLLLQVQVSDGGCWVFGGSTTNGGYGVIWNSEAGRTQVAHRFTFEYYVGTVPEGLDLDHLCRVRRCCRPDHLEAVTRLENVARGLRAPGYAESITKCKRGHDLTPDNLLASPRQRRCLTCHNASVRKSRQRQLKAKEQAA